MNLSNLARHAANKAALTALLFLGQSNFSLAANAASDPPPPPPDIGPMVLPDVPARSRGHKHLKASLGPVAPAVGQSLPQAPITHVKSLTQKKTLVEKMNLETRRQP